VNARCDGIRIDLGALLDMMEAQQQRHRDAVQALLAPGSPIPVDWFEYGRQDGGDIALSTLHRQILENLSSLRGADR
jgi:hypothetical protein